MVLAAVLLAGLATALRISLRSPQPVPVPPIELVTDDRGGVRPNGREPRDRTDTVPQTPRQGEPGKGDDDADDRLEEPSYHDPGEVDDGEDADE
jgi:hypothetical protein